MTKLKLIEDALLFYAENLEQNIDGSTNDCPGNPQYYPRAAKALAACREINEILKEKPEGLSEALQETGRSPTEYAQYSGVRRKAAALLLRIVGKE